VGNENATMQAMSSHDWLHGKALLFHLGKQGYYSSGQQA